MERRLLRIELIKWIKNIKIWSGKWFVNIESKLRQGIKNYGNAYHVANSNWKSIHNPITEDMISTGLNIPEMNIDADIYYNSKKSTK